MMFERNRDLSRRAFVGRMLRLGGVGAAALLAACAPAAPSAPAKPAESKPAEAPKPTQAAKPAESKPAAPAAGKTPQLSMILFDGGWTPSLKIMLEKYRADQGVEVVWDAPPLSGFYQKQLSLMLAKERTPDVISSNDTILSQYAGSGLIEPLDELLADKSLAGDYNWDDLAERTRNAASWSKELGQKGQVYGLPFELATWGYFYRSDLIEKPPETFTEYLEISKKLTRSINPSSPTQYGAAAHAKQLPPQYKEWYAWMWAYGGELFDDKLTPTLNGPEAVKSLEDFYGLLLEHKAMPPDTATYSDTEKSAAFQNEVVPHVMHWAHQWAVYLDKEKSPKIADKVKFTMVPGMPGPGGQVRRVPYAQQWMFGLNPNGQNKKEAFKFIAWLTGPVGMRAWVEAGWNSPPRPSILNDAQFKTKHPSFAVTEEAIKIGRYGPTFFKEYAQIADSKLLPALSQVLAGSQTPKQALDQVADDAREILKSAGY
jgi:multiple sugar transport system substrate-binding protein